MSTWQDLPGSAVRDFRRPSRLSVSGIGTAAMQASSTESWIVPMADRPAFLYAVIGFPAVVGGPSGSMVRVVPLQHPEAPALWAVDASSEACGWDGRAARGDGTGMWSHCRISVDFQSRPYAQSGGGAYVTYQESPATRPLRTPASGFLIGGVHPTHEPGDEPQGADFSLTINEVPGLPADNFDGLRNSTNQGVFSFGPIQGRAQGTVKYLGAAINATSNLQGLTYSVAHSFSYSEVPWNFDYAADGTLALLTRADGSYRYPLADFTPLFNL